MSLIDALGGVVGRVVRAELDDDGRVATCCPEEPYVNRGPPRQPSDVSSSALNKSSVVSWPPWLLESHALLPSPFAA